MHNSRRSQDGPDWASRPVPADVATHVPTHCIAPPQEPDCCPVKSRAVDETSAAWSVILSWWLRFWRVAELGGVVAAKEERLKGWKSRRRQLHLIRPLIIFLRTFSVTQEITDNRLLAFFFALWKSQLSTHVLHLVLMGHHFKKVCEKTKYDRAVKAVGGLKIKTTPAGIFRHKLSSVPLCETDHPHRIKDLFQRLICSGTLAAKDWQLMQRLPWLWHDLGNMWIPTQILWHLLVQNHYSTASLHASLDIWEPAKHVQWSWNPTH